MAIIGMREVCWGFAEKPLLDNVSFQIEKGERVGLVGRNGVGKSTLLKLLGGEMDPDSGEINSLTLPYSYTLEYSVEGQGDTFLGRWSLNANEWMQNGKLDPSYFKVP